MSGPLMDWVRKKSVTENSSPGSKRPSQVVKERRRDLADLRDWTRRPSFIEQPAHLVPGPAAAAAVPQQKQQQQQQQQEQQQQQQQSWTRTSTPSENEDSFSTKGDDSFSQRPSSGDSDPRASSSVSSLVLAALRRLRKHMFKVLRSLFLLLLYYGLVSAAFTGLEGKSLLDSIYFATVLMSTVGCTPLPHTLAGAAITTASRLMLCDAGRTRAHACARVLR